MPSFDVVSEVDKQELKNAVDQTNKEVSTRFDFKGSDARVEQNDFALTVYADDDFKLDQVKDVLNGKLSKRNIDLRTIEAKDIQKVSGGKVKQEVIIKTGVETELAKKIIRVLKDSKLKAQGSIQGDTVRVTGPKRDVLQEAIALLRKEITELPLQFNNFRD